VEGSNQRGNLHLAQLRPAGHSGCQNRECGHNLDKCPGAGARLDKAVQWDLDDEDQFVLKMDAVTLEPSHKRQTAITIRKVMGKRRDDRLHSLPSQGRAMELVSKAKASAHFIRNSTFTRFMHWRFIHRARLDLLPVCGKPWMENKGCRRCDWEFESLCHILNHRNRTMTSMTKRHNDIVRKIKTAVGNPRTGYELLFENQTIPGTPPAHRTERPDLVTRKVTKVFVIDVTIPFENGEDAFKEARKRKQEKYGAEERTDPVRHSGRIHHW